MADSSLSSSPAMEIVSPYIPRHCRRSQRIDYHLLNDGSDDEAPTEDRIFKRPRLEGLTGTLEPITPDDSASQLDQARSSPVESLQQTEFPVCGSSEISQRSTLSTRGRPQNDSLWAQFIMSPLPGKFWSRKGSKRPAEDRKIQCRRCNWQTSDSARATSTSNMKNHIAKHEIFLHSTDGAVDGGIKQQSISSLFRKRAETEISKLLEQNLIRWTVLDNMAFTAIESPAFQQIFKDTPGIALPFTCRKAVARRIDAEFILRFQGAGSYIRCLAHVLNLIVDDILSALKSGDNKTAVTACDLMQENKEIGMHSVVSRLRIMSLWIARTPQRKQQWKVVCQTHRLNDKFIEYDVDTRWNSTFRMIRDALQAKQQIKKWIDNQAYLPPFTTEDWEYLHQIELILAKFEEFTLTVSKRQPQISLAIPIYYDLHDILNDASSREGEFSGLSPDIASAVSSGLDKFKKYYELMDGQDAYYVAQVLDPRFKTLLLEKVLDKVSAPKVISHIKGLLHEQYPPSPRPDSTVRSSPIEPAARTIEARILQKLQPPRRQHSDIDRYYEDGVVTAQDPAVQDKEWLFSWWRAHCHEYPRVGSAARDYLAIPASEVAVERLFNSGRDLLGLRRHSLHGETMRRLVLLRDVYKPEGSTVSTC
ncbi:uncharacterized protein N7506_001885 [Penicillium brevicompactum]|uniref:uncharacterized protein n=1 Tax=Penicillium brevicompactum TaxID=5074 RepID=UPI0025414167|nr:uncharacterized protein N7506_001885 [Penicillium brevicompactum]KAJ5348632.1 hypothetical protein N7506_001885 [Penicillium brevicompactum]